MNRLILTLILVFFISSLGLVYILWNRRRFQRESSAAADDLESSGVSSGSGRLHASPPLVKELVLYCLCLKNLSRIEPTATCPNTTTAFSVTVNPAIFKPPQPPSEEEESNDDDDELEMEKLRHESRLLYTINEEEEEAEELEGVALVESKVDGLEEEEELISFLSACSSPLYSTPASSPPHVTPQTCFHPTVGKQ